MGDPPQCDDIAGHPLGASRRLWFYQTLYPAGTTQRLMSRCERNCVFVSVSQSVSQLILSHNQTRSSASGLSVPLFLFAPFQKRSMH